MNWRCGSSNILPALQVGSPEFKPQNQLKEKKKKEGERERLYPSE
jgi:hypothetical protein